MCNTLGLPGAKNPVCVFVHIRITYTPTVALAPTPLNLCKSLILLAFLYWFLLGINISYSFS